MDRGSGAPADRGASSASPVHWASWRLAGSSGSTGDDPAAVSENLRGLAPASTPSRSASARVRQHQLEEACAAPAAEGLRARAVRLASLDAMASTVAVLLAAQDGSPAARGVR